MYCLIYDHKQDGYLEFKNPRTVIQTFDIQTVTECLNQVQSAVDQQNVVAGFICYEAASAFDEAFTTHEAGPLPLSAFGVFDSAIEISGTRNNSQDWFQPWQSKGSLEEYNACILRIKEYIAAGDTYQVNYTFKLVSRILGDPKQMFLTVQDFLKAEYAAYIELGDQVICSFSPELFFTWDGEILRSKPMKGTAPRGLTLAEDRERMLELSGCPKNRAENIMIVDMIRNDMGRIARTGSVDVPCRFNVERHPYVLQMTSDVVAGVSSSFPQIIKALFPCGSITGAPKVRTMEIIKELESEPRGIYTGTIGYLTPEKKACFSVAIRTLVIDRQTRRAEYGVGSGIVWDSESNSEYQECLLKSDFLNRSVADFSLIESLLWDQQDGYFLLEEHLMRLSDSAEYFNYFFDKEIVLNTLVRFGKTIPLPRAKVRLTLDQKGRVDLEFGSLAGVKSTGLQIGLARTPVDSRNRFLYHKTTQRSVYDKARKERPECDDVILWNEKGEITESCRANVVAEIDGKLVTPPIVCGLLGGTFRESLLRNGEIEEKIITTRELQQALRIFTINSVRKWMDVTLVI